MYEKAAQEERRKVGRGSGTWGLKADRVQLSRAHCWGGRDRIIVVCGNVGAADRHGLKPVVIIVGVAH